MNIEHNKNITNGKGGHLAQYSFSAKITRLISTQC